jgi:hypothetical protein
LANNETYFTGVAAANPNADPARVTITLFSSSGTLFGQAAYTIPPNGRLSRLLSQIVPELPPMSRGYFRLSANVPIVSFAVFGTHSLTALSAIPPQ